MTSFIIEGSFQKRQEYLKEFIEKGLYKPFEVEKFEGKINVEIVRNIKKSLLLKVATKKLIILEGIFTISSQNALLKSIEETPQNIVFMISVSKKDEMLPTIISRCTVVTLGFEMQDLDEELYQNLKLVATNTKNTWEAVEVFVEKYKEDRVFEILQAARNLLVLNYDTVEISKYYKYCKKLLQLLPLYEKNNVNLRVVLEKTFVDHLTLPS